MHFGIRRSCESVQLPVDSIAWGRFGEPLLGKVSYSTDINEANGTGMRTDFQMSKAAPDYGSLRYARQPRAGWVFYPDVTELRPTLTSDCEFCETRGE